MTECMGIWAVTGLINKCRRLFLLQAVSHGNMLHAFANGICTQVNVAQLLLYFTRVTICYERLSCSWLNGLFQFILTWNETVPHKPSAARVPDSGIFIAEISVRSPRKLFIFIIFKKNLCHSIQKVCYLFLKTEALVPESHLPMHGAA